MSVNRVFIMGNLGQDPELRYTPSQNAVVTLNVATTESRMVEGQRQDQTEWHRIVVWGKQAESCAKYLKKGRSVFVEGRLQTRSWDDKNGGGKKYMTEIIAQNVRFIGGASRSEGDHASSSSHSSSSPASGYGNDDAGSSFGGSMSPSSSFDQNPYGGPSTPSSIDEIPF